MKRWNVPAMCLALVLGAGPALAHEADADFERGWRAYQSQDYAAAAAAWRRAAERGHPRAQNGLGVLFRDGLGVEKDPASAITWFRISAEKGYAYAMFNLGLAYRDGIGVPRSEVEAYKWLLLASTVNYDREAAFERELVARRMSGQQLKEARARAQAWLDQFFFGSAQRKPKARTRVPRTE